MTDSSVLTHVSAAPTEAEWLERVEALAPVVRANVAWQEANRRMAPVVFEALARAGMFALWKPRAVGGFEVAPVTALKVFEALSRLDASVGWAVANQDGLDSLIGAVLSPEGALEVLADPNRPVSGASFPPGVARRVDDGYVVNGQWPFSSTCHHAQTYVGSCLLRDGDDFVMAADGLPVRLLVFSQSPDVEIIDTWRTMGMRGSGSHDIAMRDLFVPARHVGELGRTDVAGDGPFAGAVYALSPWLSIATSGPVGLGIAEAALDAFGELATAKTPNYTTRRVADRDQAQAVMGRCRAIVNGARAYLHQSVEAAYQARLAGERVSTPLGLDIQLSSCAALEAGTKVVAMVHEVVGTSGFREEHRFEQLLRDSHTIGQNTFASTARYEAVGNVLFGGPTDWPILAWGLARSATVAAANGATRG
jgi:alkylation response protein AidB-like acyl-CoA dehydrogenase